MLNTVLHARIQRWTKSNSCSHGLILSGKIQTICTCYMNAKKKSKASWGEEHYFRWMSGKISLTRGCLSRSLSETRKQAVQIFGERENRKSKGSRKERKNKASMHWVGNQGENSRKWDQRRVEMVFGVGYQVGPCGSYQLCGRNSIKCLTNDITSLATIWGR